MLARVFHTRASCSSGFLYSPLTNISSFIIIIYCCWRARCLCVRFARKQSLQWRLCSASTARNVDSFGVFPALVAIAAVIATTDNRLQCCGLALTMMPACAVCDSTSCPVRWIWYDFQFQQTTNHIIILLPKVITKKSKKNTHSIINVIAFATILLTHRLIPSHWLLFSLKPHSIELYTISIFWNILKSICQLYHNGWIIHSFDLISNATQN